MGNEVSRKLLADETWDTANYEQLSLSIRWVNEIYEVNEDFIGFVHVARTTAFYHWLSAEVKVTMGF